MHYAVGPLRAHAMPLGPSDRRQLITVALDLRWRGTAHKTAPVSGPPSACNDSWPTAMRPQW
eukprot:3813537-Lingulodinium_polyedra.AAC.1